MPKAQNEIKHSQYLAANDPELLWGWGTSAGQVRADRRASLIIQGAGLKPGIKVLEIGCGSGFFTQKFAASGAQILACDISAELIFLARSKTYPHENVSFVNAPFEDSSIPGPFDAVIGSSILHHLNLEESLKKIHSLLKPKGRLSFAEPNMLNPQVFAERKFRRFFDYVSADETAFVRCSLKSKLQSQGFTEIDIKPFDWLHPKTPEKLISFLSRVGGCLEKIPIISEFAGSLVITATRS